MLPRHESHLVLIEGVSGDIGKCGVECALMPYYAICEGVLTEVLGGLLAIASGCCRSVDKCETDSVVIWFVPAIFAVIHNGHSV